MSGTFHSLTDLLKHALHFCEALSARDLALQVRRRMLRDLPLSEVEQRVLLCLRQHGCFYADARGLWRLNLEGDRQNDRFYHFLLTTRRPASLKEFHRNAKKKARQLVAEEAALITDGRFVHYDHDRWGLTEWGSAISDCSLKQLVIRALQSNPAGLSTAQVCQVVSHWRTADRRSVEYILRKYPYFEQTADDLWFYNAATRVVYERLLDRYLRVLERQKGRYRRVREAWERRHARLEKQLAEVEAAQREVAAALAARAAVEEANEQLHARLAEKDLLLTLRKKEILHYRDQLRRTEAKANSILHQCRLWVQRARDGEAETVRLRAALEKAQSGLEAMFAKLQQYRDRDRENKARLAELKEQHATRVAELQTEIITLKERLERQSQAARREEQRLREEVHVLSQDLKEALENVARLERELAFAQGEAQKLREDRRRLEQELRSPLVRLVLGFTRRVQHLWAR